MDNWKLIGVTVLTLCLNVYRQEACSQVYPGVEGHRSPRESIL